MLTAFAFSNIFCTLTIPRPSSRMGAICKSGIKHRRNASIYAGENKRRKSFKNISQPLVERYVCQRCCGSTFYTVCDYRYAITVSHLASKSCLYVCCQRSSRPIELFGLDAAERGDSVHAPDGIQPLPD